MVVVESAESADPESLRDLILVLSEVSRRRTERCLAFKKSDAARDR